MKILMAVHNYPPEFTGGVERAVEVLATGLIGRGHEVHVFAGSKDAAPASEVRLEARAGVTVHRFVRRDGYVNVVDTHDPEGDAAWDALLDEVEPDVVHVHHWYHLSNQLVAIATRRGIPALCTLHDFWTTCTLFFRMPDDAAFCREKERVDACLPCVAKHHDMERSEMEFSFGMRFASLAQELRLARTILVSSRKHLQNLAGFGRFPRDVFSRIRVLPMGASTLEPQPPRPVVEDEAEDRKIIIGHWGNLTPVKGIEVLVRAAARSKSARRIRLKVLGEFLDNNLSVRLRDLAGPVRLDLRGRYQAADLPQLVEDVDFAVFPSLAMETHSIVLDEALLLGLPVIVSDRGALPERIGGRGRVVAAGDVDALADAIDALVDPATRARAAAAPAGDLVDAATYAGRVEAVYEDVIRKGPASGDSVQDYARDRLAFRNHRLAEIACYVFNIEQRRDLLERALAGEADAIERLREAAPELSERLDSLPGEPGSR